MPDAELVGERVLAGLERGRAIAIATAKARAAPTWRAVRRELDVDALAGNRPRGRARRIAARLWRHDVRLSERQVKRILDALSSVSDSL